MTMYMCVNVQVLELLWNLAHRDDCPTDTMDHALNAHIKILDYSCSQVECLSFVYCACTVYACRVHSCLLVD